MLAAYRQVLSKPGAAAFSASGFLARLPISMVTLGIVLLVSARTDSYGLAGGISAALVIATCLAALLQGRLVDRLGQARVLLPAITICTVSLSLLVWAVEAGYRVPLPHIFAAVAGAALPAVGAASGPAGPTCSTDPAELQTAFALEAVVDEVRVHVRPDPGHRARDHRQPGRRPGRRDRLPALVGSLAFAPSAAPSRRRTPRARATRREGPDAVAHACPGRCQLRAGHPVRRRRGHHRRLRRRAGRHRPSPARCSRCGRSAACSPAWSPARSPGGRGPRPGCGWGASAWPRDGARSASSTPSG